MPTAQRFLVKVAAVPASGPRALHLDREDIAFASEPLFGSIPAAPASSAAALGAAATSLAWRVVSPRLSIDDANAWDVCHQMVHAGLALRDDERVVFAEPDWGQPWVTGDPEEQRQAMSETCDAVPQDGRFPTERTNDWYRDASHARLAPLAGTGQGVRIAHLDTGYDPGHLSKPAGLEENLARNFVDADRPNDARDDAGGLWNNRGHGTGTLSLLAGAPVPGVGIPGVAPAASVVPLRVANRVELFYTSAIARAMDHVHSLAAGGHPVDVLSMSMGGLASQAWAEAVNALYEQGVVLVTAAGNNFGELPTHHVVYPARFNRVIAACGVMADGRPYADLGLRRMAGNYGPARKMATALSAWTPNVPWAKFGCARTVDFDGAGTSAATPQIAGVAALYIEAHRAVLAALPEPWMRVEAVRAALFRSAAVDERLGRGRLDGAATLDTPVAAPASLVKTPADTASFAFLRVLTGLGLAHPDAQRQAMFELEALQLFSRLAVPTPLADPEDVGTLTLAQRVEVARALASHPACSRALREFLGQVVAPQAPTPPSPSTSTSTPTPAPTPAPTAPTAPPTGMAAIAPRLAAGHEYPPPKARRLRVFAVDPSMATDVDTVGLNETVTSVRWEAGLEPGPVGEYLEVVDIDPASGLCYAPVDLDDPRLLAQDGLAPSEADPQFHQQMVYAIAMKTIDHFERALGRTALWAPRFERDPGGAANHPVERYVQRLRIHPHALREANAYYSPEKKALLMGYFLGRDDAPGGSAGEQLVFTALSSDIVAHETTHGLLDGLHRRFREPTNVDVLAFHEAFADIVALFQHFSLEGVLRDQVARTRGDLGSAADEALLGRIAVQFGRASGRHGALRSAIGQEAGKQDYERSTLPHDRGAVLVAAVFDAFLQIYRRRAREPIRLATGGSEVLPAGALPSDLVDALSHVAARVARQVLEVCIRALDYCPPVDITFGDFLRAAVTADRDLVPDDRYGFRVALASAFRRRGIYPEHIRTVAVDTLCWEPPPAPFGQLGALLDTLDLGWDLERERKQAWLASARNGRRAHDWLMKCTSPDERAMLGFIDGAAIASGASYPLPRGDGPPVAVFLHGIEVHSVRPARRVGPDGQLLQQLVIELTQTARAADGSGQVFRGGCTLIVDLKRRDVSYLVRKRLDHADRVARQMAMSDAMMKSVGDGYRGLAAGRAEPFAFLHRHD